jgi:hypothetical protein
LARRNHRDARPHRKYPKPHRGRSRARVGGILLAFNLIRFEMERTADDPGLEPTRTSFVSALRIVCDTWSWCALASPGALPTRLRTMRDFFPSLVLLDRQRSRRYPRALKTKMSNYSRKLPTHSRMADTEASSNRKSKRRQDCEFKSPYGRMLERKRIFAASLRWIVERTFGWSKPLPRTIQRIRVNNCIKHLRHSALFGPSHASQVGRPTINWPRLL